jgi:hypothetical protein
MCGSDVDTTSSHIVQLRSRLREIHLIATSLRKETQGRLNRTRRTVSGESADIGPLKPDSVGPHARFPSASVRQRTDQGDVEAST